VRNTCYTWLHQNRPAEPAELFDEEIHSYELTGSASPEVQVLASADKETLHRALEALPGIFREVLVLREIEGMSYKEIADVASVSLGTVMSRLARARTRLRETLSVVLGKES
jgi:RNA polymerase sigma-70 factor (ECF subfamily)